MYGPSRLDNCNNVALSSTLLHSSETARLGGYTRHYRFHCPLFLSFIRLSVIFFFPSPFVDVLARAVCRYAYGYAVITFLIF